MDSWILVGAEQSLNDLGDPQQQFLKAEQL
jgi:hypothetical protein